MTTLSIWLTWVLFYPYNRLIGWSHSDLRVIRRIAIKLG